MQGEVARYPILPGLVYRSPYDFVLEHGRGYLITDWKETNQIAPHRLCFANSISLAARNNLKYIEGFTLSPKGEIILHAWNATESGELIDSTWANTGLAYYGVEFSVERADDAIWNGDACVLNDENRNYPIFQKRWTGEDYKLAWPPSDRLEFWRNPTQGNIPPSAIEYLKGRQS